MLGRVAGLAALGCAFGACSAAAAPQQEDLDQVIIRLKQEVGFFRASQPATDAEWRALFLRLGVLDKDGKPPAGGMCGTGKIRLDIQKVGMEFTATENLTQAGGASLKIPFGPPEAAANIGPGGKVSNENVATVDEKFTYYVPDAIPDSDEWDFLRKSPGSAVIKSTLDALRDSLIKATAHRPCFKDSPATGADPDTMTFSVQIKRDLNASVGFSFFVVSANLTRDQLKTRGNTITVTFRPTATGVAAKGK